MTCSNPMTENEKVLGESDVLTRLLKDFLDQQKENEPEKLFNEACDYVENLLANPQKRLNFLQAVFLYSFRERLRNNNDDDLGENSTVSSEYATLFNDLCKRNNVKIEQDDREKLERNLDIERRAYVGSRRSVDVPLQIISNDKRGYSSLGNLKDSKTVLQTQFEISSQISNGYLITGRIPSNDESCSTRVTKSLNGVSHSSGQKDVFEGKQTATNQKVAVKSSRSKNNDAATIREAKIQASIAHQGVPTVISLNNSEVLPIIVEPYIDGKSWASKIDSQTPEEKINTLLQVGAIMKYAHREAEIVHGDLKPDNVMIDDYGQVYVIDWGYAIKLNEPDENSRIIQGSTEAYQPPEACPPKGCAGEPQPATAAADVYMLGGILHQIVVPSKKTFNETMLNASNYEVSQWKNRNQFPDIPDVAKEMCEVLKRSLSYKPENRYQDAGEFVDALKKYQKLRRFNENRERFAQCKAQAEGERSSNANKKDQKIEAARVTNNLIACVNEFASIRKELQEDFGDQNQGALKDESFLDVVKEELQARSFLLDRSIDAQDLGQAQALAETQADVAAKYQTSDQTPRFFAEIATELLSQRGRIDKGYRRRRRNNILAISALFTLVLMLAAFGFAMYSRSQASQAIMEKAEADARATEAENQVLVEQNASKEKVIELETKARRDSNQQLFDVYKYNALTAQEEKFGQGEVSFWAKALKLIDPVTKEPSFPYSCNLFDIASKTSILPQQISSFNPTANALGFSGDGRFFLLQTDNELFDVWDVETLQTVSNFNLTFPDETTTYIRANPCFENEESDNPVLSYRFLLFNTDGDVWLVSNQKDETKQATFLFNVRIAANDVKASGNFNPNDLITNEDEFKKSLKFAFDELPFTSCYITEKDAEGRALLFIGSESGEILTYSLPDFKLVGAFKTQNSIISLEASIQKKFVVVVDKTDLVCRRYSFDGTLMNEYDLDFPPADSSDDLGRRWLRIALSPSGEKLAVGNIRGAMRVWDVESNQLIAKIPNSQIEGTFKGIACLYWLDEERFLSLGHNNDCRVWNLGEIDSDGVPNSVSIDCGLPNSLTGVRTTTFSSKSQKLALEGLDSKLRLVDVNEGRLIAHTMGITTWKTPCLPITGVDYLPEKNVFILGSMTSPSDSIKSIDAETFEEIRGFNPDPDKKPTLSWFKNAKLAMDIAAPSVGSEFAVALTSGEIVFFNVDDSNPIHKIDEFSHGKEVELSEALNNYGSPIIAASPNAKFLAGTTMRNEEIVLWDWASKKEIRRWRKSSASEGAEDEITFDDNDAEVRFPTLTGYLFFIGDDRILEQTNVQLKLWNALTGELICSNEELINTNNIGSSPTICAVSKDRRKIALGKKDGSVLIVSTKDLSLLMSLESTRNLSNLNTMVHEEKLRKNNGFHIDPNSFDSISRFQVSGLEWSQSDRLLCVVYSNGLAKIFEVPKTEHNLDRIVSVASFAIDRNYEFHSKLNHLVIGSCFTKYNRLITVDSNGSIQRWDFTPSKESVKQLRDEEIEKASAGNAQRQEWAGISGIPDRFVGKRFVVYSGTSQKYESSDVGDFQYWQAPDGSTGYLTLHKIDGKLTFIDGTRYKPVPSVIDDRQGFPKNGFERVYVSPDGTKIAGIESVSYKTWILDLSQPDSKWEQIPWRDENARSFQATFSPNSQILATVDKDVLRLWDIKSKKELHRRNGSVIKGVSTSRKGDGDPISDSGTICFISENLLVQTGLEKGFIIWDVKEGSVFQETSVPLIGIVLSTRTCEALNKGLGKEKPTTFVVAGDDGVLRFYQLSKTTNRFEPIYVVSHLQLSAFNFTSLHDLSTLEPTDERSSDEFEYDISDSRIRSVSLSEDGKTLYVGSIGGLRSYNMEEIWKNIDNLPKKWQNADVESLTGLRSNSLGELTPFVPNRMIPVDK